MYITNKIAILLATYNAEEYIDEQIMSLLQQDYDQFNIYFHDDGSSDSTNIIMDKYIEKYPDRIHRISGGPTGSAAKNFFLMMREVDAPIYMFCDQDDFWMKNKISITFHKLSEINNEIKENVPVLISTDLQVVDEDLKMISPSMRKYSRIEMNEKISINKLLIQNYAVGCTMMFNKALRNMAVISYNEAVIMHDWWLAFIANTKGVFVNLDTSTIKYRQHRNNEVGAANVGVKYSIKMLGKIMEKHDIIKKTRLQAEAFTKYFPETDEIIAEYGKLDDKCKIYRMCFHIKNGINKQGFFRKVGIILCC